MLWLLVNTEFKPDYEKFKIELHVKAILLGCGRGSLESPKVMG